MKRKTAFFLAAAVMIGMMISCTVQRTPIDVVAEESAKFISSDPSSKDEVFRVLLSSEGYKVAQVNAKETIMRPEDPSGDQFMCEDLAKYDKINETRLAIYTIELYPDTGRVYKIRPKRLANLTEIDTLIVQDLQRWTVANPDKKKKEVSPLKFEVTYRIVLKKKMSDEAILQEKRDALKEKSSQ